MYISYSQSVSQADMNEENNPTTSGLVDCVGWDVKCGRKVFYDSHIFTLAHYHDFDESKKKRFKL